MVLGDKLTLADLLQIDESKYHELQGMYPSPDEDDLDAPNPPLDRALEEYFQVYQEQTNAIRCGMNEVLDGKLDVIAYLPL